MTDVHPTLRKCAEALAVSVDGKRHRWEDWLPEARAMLRALADSWPYGGVMKPAGVWLHEIAAEPPTAEDVLRKHEPDVDTLRNSGPRGVCTGCGWRGPTRAERHPRHRGRETALRARRRGRWSG